MLFVLTYTTRGTSTEANEKRVLQLFKNWKPAAGHEIKGWWVTTAGLGVQVAEAASAAALLESISPWAVYFEFNVQPAVEVAQAVELLTKGAAWRDGVK